MDPILTFRSRILVAVDDTVLSQTLVEVLESAGYDVTAQGAPADFQLVLAVTPLSDPAVPYLIVEPPVRVGPLLAGIEQALLADRPAPVQIGPWLFDPAARWLERGEERVRLTDKETAILEHLLMAPGIVGREELLAAVWGYSSEISTHTLETHIYRLRQKIEADPTQAALLLTEAGGYRLSREVG